MKVSRYLILILLILISCYDHESPVEIYKVDISDAKVFLAAALNFSESSLKVTKTEGASRMYKVTTGNKIEEVKFLNVDGVEVDPDSRIRQIVDINSTYFYLEFFRETYIVRKQDGHAFRIPEQAFVWEMLPGMLGTVGPAFHTDKRGNLYYRLNSNAIAKLDVSNPYNPTQTVLTGLGEQAIAYCIDQEGNLAYTGVDILNRPIFRWRSAGGAVSNLPCQDGALWFDYQKNIYYASDLLPSVGYESTTVRLNPVTQEFESIEVDESCGVDFIGSYGGVVTIRNKQQFIFVYSEGIRIFDAQQNSFCNLSASIFDLKSIRAAAEGVDQYFLAGLNQQGKNVLIKVDPDTNGYTTLIDGGYDIMRMAAAQNGEVIFVAPGTNGIQFVLGHVSLNGEVTLLRESVPDLIWQLETVLDLP